MKSCRHSKNNKKVAYGIIDHIVNKLPEIHIPGYQYCGPGTDLNKRLSRGDPGINELDRACKVHDIGYSNLKDSKSRRAVDKILLKSSLQRIISSDAKLSERAAAILVSSLIGAKMGLTKMGLGVKNKRMKKVTPTRRSKRLKDMQKPIAFGELVRDAKANIKKTPPTENFNASVKAAIRSVKQLKRNKAVKVARVLKVPKFGGNINQILSVLSALSAVGFIPSTPDAVARALKGVKSFVTQKKANSLSDKKIGRGLYLTRKVKGSGIYLRPVKPH